MLIGCHLAVVIWIFSTRQKYQFSEAVLRGDLGIEMNHVVLQRYKNIEV